MKKGLILTRTTRCKLAKDFNLFVEELQRQYERFEYTEHVLTVAKDYTNLRRVHRKKRECKRVLVASRLLLESELFNPTLK